MVCEGWEGLTVDGRFPLLEWLGGWADRCVFLTVGQATHKANIRLLQVSGPDANATVSKWEAAKSLSHPCLLQMMETGRYSLRDTDVAYVVTEKAESFLSGIIPQQALSAERMNQILGPIVDALSFLHENGYVHGSLKPSSVVLVGTQWKLSPDEMDHAGRSLRLNRELDTYDAPELGTGTLTAAADMWSLGIILVEACSQRTPVWDRNAAGDLGVPDWLPQPFREIARGCLRWDPAKRMSIDDAKALLARTPDRPTAAVPSENERRIEQERGASETSPAVSSLAERVAEVRASREDGLHPVATQRVFEAEPELTPRSRLFANLDEDEEEPSRKGPVLFGLVVLLAIGAVFGFRYKDRLLPLIEKQSPPAVSQTTPATQPDQNQPTSPDQNQPTSPSAGSQPPAQTQAQSSAGEDQSTESSQKQNQNTTAQPTTQPSPVPPQPAPATQNASPLQTEKEPEPVEPKKEESKAKEDAEAPRVMNAKGAVLKRVVPNVAPGARASMRRPMQVDVRVRVNENGSVSSAQCMTQAQGNYFARISQQAAHSWKFKPPVSGGHPRESEWMLLFQFDRARTDVIATELH